MSPGVQCPSCPLESSAGSHTVHHSDCVAGEGGYSNVCEWCSIKKDKMCNTLTYTGKDKISHILYINKELQKFDLKYNKVSLPVLVGGCVKPRIHHWMGQVEMLQVKREWLPGCLINITNPLTFNLHGDGTLTGSKDLQGIPLAQVCKTPRVPLT